MADIAVTQAGAVPWATRVPRTRLLYLDGWRGVSIALVLIGHFFPVPGINIGLLGVEFFFVLSGRLMAEILFVEQYPLKKFFKRRFSRIYPALLVYVLVTMVALSGTFIAFKWKAALAALTFTFNYVGIFVNRAGALDHIWSLCIEEHAYVILAMLSLFFVANGRYLIALLAALSLAAMMNGAVSRWGLDQSYETVYWRTDVHIASILVSVLLCLLKARGQYPDILKGRFVSAAAATGAVILFLDAVPMPLHYILGTSLLAIAVNSLDFSAKPVVGILSSRPIVLLGLWSYSLYLWQQPFYKFVYDQDSAPLPMLAASFGCAICSYYLVEKPSREWLNRNW